MRSLPPEVQQDIRDFVSKTASNYYSEQRPSRPSWADKAMNHNVSRLIRLQQMLKRAEETGRPPELIDKIKAEIKQRRVSAALCITLSPEINRGVHEILDKHYPKAEAPDPATAAASGTKPGAPLDGDQRREMIKKQIVRARVSGMIFSGTSSTVNTLIAQEQLQGKRLDDTQIKKGINRSMNDISAGIITAENIEVDNLEEDMDLAAFDEHVFEVEKQAELDAENNLSSEVSADDDYYLDHRVSHRAAEEGMELAADRIATESLTERYTEVADAAAEVAVDDPEALKGAAEAISRSEQQLARLGKARAVMSEGSMRNEWSRMVGEEMDGKGDPKNSILHPRSAGMGAKTEATETAEAASRFTLTPPAPEAPTTGSGMGAGGI